MTINALGSISRTRDFNWFTSERVTTPSATAVDISELRWQPDEAFFNEWALNAPKGKELILNRYIFPKHGQPDQTWYLAIESNDETARMYASYAIDRHRARDVRNPPGVLVKRGPAIDIPRLF